MLFSGRSRLRGRLFRFTDKIPVFGVYTNPACGFIDGHTLLAFDSFQPAGFRVTFAMPQKPDKKPSLADVAKRAGVSPMTVSRALRNLPKVSQEVRMKILKVAEEMGYSHDSEISRVMRLMRQSRKDSFFESIGFVMLCPKGIVRNDGGFFGLMIKGAKERARQLNYSLDVFYIEDYQSHPARLRDILLSRGVRGILLSPSMALEDTPPFELEGFIPVGVGHTHVQEVFNLVRFNHYSGMVSACRSIRKLGYRKPALIMENSINERMERRWSSAFTAFADPSGKPVPQKRLLLANSLSKNKVVDFYRSVQPDVMVVSDWGIASWLEEAGVRIPGDVAIATMNYDVEAPRWAGIDQCYDEWGARAVDLVTALLHRTIFGAPHASQSILVEGVWRDGSSVPGRK
jgi:DNA-binding LacI/PurR family transcriptional regulator